MSKLKDILENEGVKFAYIFGSHATNTNNIQSDMDIAVYLEEKDQFKRFNKKIFLISKLTSILKKSVDIVILNDINNDLLLLDIITKGKVLIDNDSDFRFYFENTKQHQALDFLTHLEYAS